MMAKHVRVENISHLRSLAESNEPDFYIVLNGGLVSRKRIAIIKDEKTPTYDVYNFIDDSEQTITEKDMFDTSITHIGEALSKGDLFFEGGAEEICR